MKNKFFTLILFVAVTQVQAQDMKSLQAAAEKMYSASYKLDFNTVVDYSYPKLFEIASKESMVTMMKNTFENENMTITFTKPKVTFNYGNIKTIDGRKFCVIKYPSGMKMTLHENLAKETIDSMVNNFKNSGKYSSVTYDEKTKSLLIEGDAIMIAIADSTTKNEWTFVNYDENIFKMLFDENIKKELGL